MPSMNAGAATHPKRRGTKATRLAAEIRELILGERLLPGDELPSEGELIHRTGYARATVRESIRLLAADGLIEVRTGRVGGIMVARPAPERLGEVLATQLVLESATVGALMEFRRLIEPIAASLAAARATPEQLELMQLAIGADTIDAELDFHLYVADASGNDLLRLMLRAVHTGLRDEGVYHASASPSDKSSGRRAHRSLYLAIASGDSSAAEARMIRHLKAVERVVRSSGRNSDRLRAIAAQDG